MSSFSITIFILVVIFIQASFAPMLFHGLVQPDLILTSIAIAALLFDKRKAFAIAMAGGLIQDIIIGNFFGLHLLPYLLITAEDIHATGIYLCLLLLWQRLCTCCSPV